MLKLSGGVRSPRHCHRRHHSLVAQFPARLVHPLRQLLFTTHSRPVLEPNAWHVLQALTDIDERATILSIDGKGAQVTWAPLVVLTALATSRVFTNPLVRCTKVTPKCGIAEEWLPMVGRSHGLVGHWDFVKGKLEALSTEFVGKNPTHR